MLKIGIKGYQEKIVEERDAAKVYGSGTLDVFATPAMIALMEATCLKSVAPLLEEGMGTVGTGLEIRHLAATPIGIKVYCESMLVEVDRRRLVFEVNTFDEKGKIGEGRHERFIIQEKTFQEKADKKREQE